MAGVTLPGPQRQKTEQLPDQSAEGDLGQRTVVNPVQQNRQRAGQAIH